MWLKLLVISLFGFSCILSDSFDVSGIVSGNRMAAVPLGRSLGEGEVDIEGICTEAGMACQNCTHAVTCIPLPIGWLKVPLQQCSNNQTCNAHKKQCSNESVPECEAVTLKYQHICEQVGIFPDAYDCRKFHLCSPPDGLPDGKPAEHRAALCPRHYGYDPSTAQCSRTLKDGQCSQKPVPSCAKVGQSGALDGSPSHYYVCLSRHGKLFPQIFICPHGWHFMDNYCRPKPDLEQKNGLECNESKNSADTSVSSDSKEDNEVINKEHVFVKTTSRPIFKIDDFFSTDKIVVYPPDNFLADKFDLNNYETFDDLEPSNNNEEFANSLENGADFW